MKIVASTLAGIEYSLENAFVFIESLGLDYAELVHQFAIISNTPYMPLSWTLTLQARRISPD